MSNKLFLGGMFGFPKLFVSGGGGKTYFLFDCVAKTYLLLFYNFVGGKTICCCFLKESGRIGCY